MTVFCDGIFRNDGPDTRAKKVSGLGRGYKKPLSLGKCPQHIMDMAGDHARAVGGDDTAQVRHRQARPMLCSASSRAVRSHLRRGHGRNSRKAFHRPESLPPEAAVTERAGDKTRSAPFS